MNIFISWSGDLSKQIGEVFKDWMPTVIQSIKPYFTPSDIEKGSKWESEISKKLSECNIGIILLTKDNLNSQWIMFEAGALSNKLDKSRVCPILIEIENPDLTGPLSTFQTTKFNQEDIKQLMSNINGLCGDNKLTDKVFNEVFKVFWPHLEEKISNVIAKHKETNKSTASRSVKRPDRDILEEILELTRMNSMRKDDLIIEKGFIGYENLPALRKEKLKEIVQNYIKSNNIRLKEFRDLDREEICRELEKDLKVRRLVESPDILRKFVSDYLDLKI